MPAAGDGADGVAVDGNFAPAEERLAFGGDRLLDDVAAALAQSRVARQEGHADAVFAGGRQGHAAVNGDRAEVLVGYLDENTGAVGGVRVGTAGAAVVQVGQYFDALQDDVV